MPRAFLLVMLLWGMSSPARAQDLGYGFTCSDVRKLTAAEIIYWQWRFKVTDAQVRAIKRTCKIK